MFKSLFAVTILALALLPGCAGAQSGNFGPLKVQTEFRSIELDAVRSGGPPPNGIPPLGFENDAEQLPDTNPAQFETVAAASAWLTPREPVILVTVGNETGIFPLQVLIWHEIANATLGGVPLAVTFCPLCNTALVADRRVPIGSEQRSRLTDNLKSEKSVLVSFGVSGLLYNSDLVMFDSATHSLWYQAIGRGVVGPLTGTQLRIYPSAIVPFAEAAKDAPQARVLSKNTGYERQYGRNPYVGYDDANKPPFLYSGPLDGRLPPKERVVTVSIGTAKAAYPFSVLAELGAVNDTVGETPVAVLWAKGTNSALDAGEISAGQDIGAGVVFDRRLDGQTLTFASENGVIRDRETNSTWTLTGQAVSGQLKGQRLKPVAHVNPFWFAWAAYAPETRIYAPR